LTGRSVSALLVGAGSGVEAWAGADDGARVMGLVGAVVLAALLAVACCWLASVARPRPHEAYS